jgi:hypothetical protein
VVTKFCANPCNQKEVRHFGAARLPLGEGRGKKNLPLLNQHHTFLTSQRVVHFLSAGVVHYPNAGANLMSQCANITVKDTTDAH